MPIPGFLARFSRDRRASVVPMFAFALVPMLALIGAAVDYSRASATKTSLQAALDATALAMSKQMMGQTTAADISAQAQQYFNAVFLRQDVMAAPVITAQFDPASSQVVVRSSAQIKTYFMGVHNASYLGFPTLTVGASSTAKWGNTRLRVALVLDNTGSMAASGKMTALQNASNNLVDQLQGVALTPEDVYVSITPFSKDVAVDPAANYTQTWIDWTDWNTNYIATHGTCTIARYTSQRNCTRNGGTWTQATQAQAVAAHNTWNGCITDRGTTGAPSVGDYDRNIAPPDVANTETLYPAEQYSNCPLQMMGLTNDWTAMHNLINSMFPNGNTNQPVGLVWGWLSLAGVTPMTAPPIDPAFQYKQVVILLSDGLNTQDRWYTVQSDIDGRMLSPVDRVTGVGTCKNIKAAGIEIYTVQVDIGGADGVSDLLKQCASDDSHYFHLESSDEIVSTFQQIGTNLTKLKIAF